MAKVIEFYIPPRFAVKVKDVPHEKVSPKIIEFPSGLQKPA